MKLELIGMMLLISLPFGLWAQSEGEIEEEGKHSIGLVISHAHSFQGIDGMGGRQVIVLPMWGLDYNYRLNAQWALGLHVDVIVESFAVERVGSEDEILERTYPVAPALMGFYKWNAHWQVGFGGGFEWSEEESLALNRVALEYGLPIREKLELVGVLQYDWRWDAYDTWSLGIGVLRSF